MMKLLPPRVLFVVAVAVLLPAAAWAQDYKNQGYWVDGSGKIVTSPVSGMCWRSGSWTPAMAVEPCDPVAKRTAAVPEPLPKPVETAVAPIAPIASVAPDLPLPTAKPSLLPTKLSFSADALFGFDKSEIKAEGKQMLDELVSQLNGAQYERVVLTGHADRVGNAQYNQKLSERRATVVKDYLVEKHVPGDRISVVGMGETEPMTTSADCVRLKRAALVVCLQPDRRVDVEMTGTKTAFGN